MQYLESLKYVKLLASAVLLPRLSKLNKLLKLLDSMDVIEVNNTIYINTDRHIVINHTGTMLIHSKDGYMITKHRRTHINPNISISTVDINQTKTLADDKAILNNKMSLFNRLLKRGKICNRP